MNDTFDDKAKRIGELIQLRLPPPPCQQRLRSLVRLAPTHRAACWLA